MTSDIPTEREDLLVLRSTLFAHLSVADPAVSAQIAGRLQAVITRLADLSAPQEATLDDALAQRRKARALGGMGSAGRKATPAS